MKPGMITVFCAACLTLAACENEPEERVDISDAIPAEDNTESTDTESSGSARPDDETGNSQPSTDASKASGSSSGRMESGSNTDDGQRSVDDPNSKLQKADPA